ncbi:diacylglycerol kinase [Microbacteriaceae bacterium MWH-Ta3]|nr:diacylglycerol kinase [Microbacteriaceae bacterium MWH-Ta3]
MTTPSHRSHLAVAINPSASQGKGKDVGPHLVEALRATGRTVDVIQTDSYEHLLAGAKQAVAAGIDALIVVGGDGTAQLGTNACAGTDVPLGVMPSGTGNDTACGMLGMPEGDIDAAIATIIDSLDKPARHIDAGVMTHDGIERWFVSTVSAGFDGKVNERTNHMRWPKGPNRYIVAMLLELVGLKPIHYILTLDGVRTEEQGVLLTVANNRRYGGGMLICPSAKWDDGLLDVMVVRPVSRFDLLRIFPKVFTGEHVKDPRVEIRLARRIRLESPGLVGYSDGERIGPLPFDIEVRPGALAVLATASQ